MAKDHIHLTLTTEQRAKYEQLKGEILRDIEEGLKAFDRAGRKLLIIRDRRLYREEYYTFEEFCRAVLGHSRTYATHLIAGHNLIQDFVA